MWDKIDVSLMQKAFFETLYMTSITAFIISVLGLLIGILLFVTDKDGLAENPFIHALLNAYVNVTRSIPFLILIILLIPLTKITMGTILGPNAAFPALIIGSAPFFARMVELALREVPYGLIEAAISLGASRTKIVFQVLVKEALPSLISGLTVTTISLIGLTAISGAIGAGGLGNLAYIHGFQRGNQPMMYVATALILVCVFVIQIIGDLLKKTVDKR